MEWPFDWLMVWCWDLPPYRITIWLVDGVVLRFTTLWNYHLIGWWCGVAIYHHIELPFDWLIVWCWFFVCLLDDLILGFSYSNLARKKDGLELASTITLALQPKQLTKCASDHTLRIATGCQVKNQTDSLLNFPNEKTQTAFGRLRRLWIYL